MISEISTPKTQAKAFSLFAFSGTVSIFFAPLAGGLLVKPAENFRLFRNFQLFITYPYLLPCLLTGLISLAAALTNLFFLEETLKKVDKLGEPTDSAPAPTVTEIFKAPGVLIVCIIYAWTFILGFANMASMWQSDLDEYKLRSLLTSACLFSFCSPASIPVYAHTPRRIRLLSQANLHLSFDCRRQSSFLESFRLYFAASEDRKQGHFAVVRKSLAHCHRFFRRFAIRSSSPALSEGVLGSQHGSGLLHSGHLAQLQCSDFGAE